MLGVHSGKRPGAGTLWGKSPKEKPNRNCSGTHLDIYKLTTVKGRAILVLREKQAQLQQNAGVHSGKRPGAGTL